MALLSNAQEPFSLVNLSLKHLIISLKSNCFLIPGRIIFLFHIAPLLFLIWCIDFLINSIIGKLITITCHVFILYLTLFSDYSLLLIFFHIHYWSCVIPFLCLFHTLHQPASVSWFKGQELHPRVTAWISVLEWLLFQMLVKYKQLLWVFSSEISTAYCL